MMQGGFSANWGFRRASKSNWSYRRLRETGGLVLIAWSLLSVGPVAAQPISAQPDLLATLSGFDAAAKGFELLGRLGERAPSSAELQEARHLTEALSALGSSKEGVLTQLSQLQKTLGQGGSQVSLERAATKLAEMINRTHSSMEQAPTESLRQRYEAHRDMLIALRDLLRPQDLTDEPQSTLGLGERLLALEATLVTMFDQAKVARLLLESLVLGVRSTQEALNLSDEIDRGRRGIDEALREYLRWLASSDRVRVEYRSQQVRVLVVRAEYRRAGGETLEYAEDKARMLAQRHLIEELDPPRVLVRYPDGIEERSVLILNGARTSYDWDDSQDQVTATIKISEDRVILLPSVMGHTW